MKHNDKGGHDKMFDILSVVFIWVTSLFFASISIYQPKGKDWYSPVNNKQKMIMTIINISLMFFEMVFLYAFLLEDIRKTIMVSVVFLFIVTFMGRKAVVDLIKKVGNHFGRIQVSEVEALTDYEVETIVGMEDGFNSDNTEEDEEKNSLWDLFQRFLTVFNTLFGLLNIGYVFYIASNMTDGSVYDNVIKDNSVSVSFTILFWSTFCTSIITSKGWNYYDIAHKKKRVTPQGAKYFSNRITNRH